MIVYNYTRTFLVALVLLNFFLCCKENNQSIKSETIPQIKLSFLILIFLSFSKNRSRRPSEERELGLMFRNFLKRMKVCFCFQEGTGQRFWMKTQGFLWIGYISTSGVLLEVHSAKPYDLSGVPSRSQDIKFVLELNAGGYKDLGIKIGSRIPLKIISELLIQRGLDPLIYNL